jgi:polyphenol oxidase
MNHEDLPLLRPDWPVPARVRAACSLRAGGVSGGPYDSLNLGDHVGDGAQAVRRNRERLAAALGARPVFMEQVHGTAVAQLDPATCDGIRADACFTSHRGVACTIMVADCLPVLLARADGAAVAAAHAGWRGLAAGVVEAAARSLGEGELLAWLGPCIGPEAFEVGDEVRRAFAAQDARAASCFRPHTPGKWLADLPALGRMRLAALGIAQIHGNDGSRGWCTVSNPSRFFSHRRDRVSGRFAACVWLA